MKYEVVESSPKAKELIKTTEDKIGVTVEVAAQTRHPFDRMHIAQSFAVPYDGSNENSLRSLASMKSKKTGKRFTVLKHDDLRVFEVARIA